MKKPALDFGPEDGQQVTLASGLSDRIGGGGGLGGRETGKIEEEAGLSGEEHRVAFDLFFIDEGGT